MSKSRSSYIYSIDPKDGIIVTIKSADLSSFGPNLLHLGDIKTPSKPIDVLCVLFDLEGFTDFTKQVDPQLTVPIFISDFLHWLFNDIKSQLIHDKEKHTLWAELPFFSKFMGDGVMFLWKIDLEKISEIKPLRPSDELQITLQEFICNIIVSMKDVCLSYNKFLKTVTTQHVNPPSKLRCGIARGTVIPIGNGSDYVGPCINIASRLQKFNGLSFVFSARGIDSKGFNPAVAGDYLKKRAAIRGIGDSELVYVSKEEYDTLSTDLKANLKKP